MRAKIMLLPGHDVGARLCTIAEDVLTNISVAFGHTFSLLREKIGEQSVRAYETPLTEETVEACVHADAVFLGDTDVMGAQTLLTSLQIPCRVRTFSLMDGKCFYVLQACALDAKTLHDAMAAGFALAKENGLPFHHVAPSGKAQTDWKAAFKLEAGMHASVMAKELLPPSAVELLVNDPGALGVLVVPPYAGSMLCAMATTLHGVPMMLFDECAGTGRFIYAPVVTKESKAEEHSLNPVGTILAVAQLLRGALKLVREADCVEAAVKNVLAAGWRTPDMSVRDEKLCVGTEEMLRLISDQISLAGALLRPQGGIK